MPQRCTCCSALGWNPVDVDAHIPEGLMNLGSIIPRIMRIESWKRNVQTALLPKDFCLEQGVILSLDIVLSGLRLRNTLNLISMQDKTPKMSSK